MNLLKIELRKVLPYRTFWVILGIYALLIFLFIYSSQSFTINNSQLGTTLYQFPELWSRLAYVGNVFNLLLGILIIILISDEYGFRTIRQQVIDGLSRWEIALAKFYVILGVAASSTLFFLILGLTFGLAYSTDTSVGVITGELNHLLYYFVQTVGIMSLAMLLAFTLKKSGLSIIAFIAYVMVVEPLLSFQTPDQISNFLPSKVLSSLTPNPLQSMLDQDVLSPAVALVPAVLYIGVFLLLSYLVLKLRDL